MANEKRNKRYVDGTILNITTGGVGKGQTPAIMVDVESSHGQATCNLWLTQAAIPGTAEKMREMGQPAGTGIGWVNANPKGLAGNKVRLCIYEEYYEGNWVSKTDIVGKPTAQPLDPGQLAVIDDLFKAANVVTEVPFDNEEVGA